MIKSTLRLVTKSSSIVLNRSSTSIVHKTTQPCLVRFCSTKPKVGKEQEQASHTASSTSTTTTTPPKTETITTPQQPTEGQQQQQQPPAPEQKFKNVLVEKRGRVGIITLNKPKSLNALSDDLVHDINAALRDYQEDSEVGAIILAGAEKAFAAGADIKEMEKVTMPEAINRNLLAHWHDLTNIRKPIIAAVNGYALGGGCELAMMCDIIIAGEKAVFGQPEIRIGTIPGCGGTQRLIRAVGKSKAMEIILTGNTITAAEAERMGLISRVVPISEVLNEAIKTADRIASFSLYAVQLAKEAVNSAYEMTLQEGINYERRLFHTTFGTHDQKEGMNAFVEKRNPTWKHE
eukprot:gene5378-6711_t